MKKWLLLPLLICCFLCVGWLQVVPINEPILSEGSSINYVINEQFDSLGYDETGWTEDHDSTSIVDEDNTDSPPIGSGAFSTQCLLTDSVDADYRDCYIYKSISSISELYAGVDFYLTTETLGNGDDMEFLVLKDGSTFRAGVWIKQDSSGNLQLYIRVGNYDYEDWSSSISLNQAYRIELHVNDASNLVEWRLYTGSSTTTTDSGSGSGDPGGSIDYVQLGFTGDEFDKTCYFDNMQIADDWIRENE